MSRDPMITPKQKLHQGKVLTSAHDDYAGGLEKHAFYKTNNAAISDELVQETFMKTWKYIVKGGKVEVMKAFLYHILNHLIIDQYRKPKTVSLDALVEKGFNPATDNTEDILNYLDGRKAMMLIAKLPIAYRKIVQMRYVQELTLDDMSLITKQSKNILAVKSHRGLKKLKSLYNTL